MIFDPMYFLFIVPGLALSLWASYRVKSTFNRYSQVPSRRGLTGAEAAQMLLRGAGISDVRIVRSHGMLSDHYNPVRHDSDLRQIGSAALLSTSFHAIHCVKLTYNPVWHEFGFGTKVN
jgi:Zn-dependent membrane protease YugP